VFKQFLVNLSVWIAAAWPFLLIVGLNLFLAKFDQYNDMVRNQCGSILSALAFILVLSLYGFVLLRCADRSVVMFAEAFWIKEENAKPIHDFMMRWGRWLSAGLIAIGLLASHGLVLRALNLDPIQDWTGPLRVWKFGAPVGGMLTLGAFLLLASPELITASWVAPKRWTGPWPAAAAITTVVVLGLFCASPANLKWAAQAFVHQSALISHVLLLILVLIIAALRTLAAMYKVPLAPAVICVTLVGVLIGVVLANFVPSLDNRAVEHRAPKPTVPYKWPTGTGPIVIFVAEGGGIHALYRASVVLAMIESEIPGAYGDIYATSTVSGGSVGTALFASIYDQKPEDLLSATQRASGKDFLMPVLLRLTFAEPLGAIYPSPNFDRGRALEYSLQSAAESVGNSDFLKQGLGEIDYSKHPYFCFNTTSAISGQRFVLAPIFVRGTKGLRLHRLLPETSGAPDTPDPADVAQDVTLQSAATLSARFPIFPGGGRLQMAPNEFERLLDGGMYDNSGLMTAFDLRRTIVENQIHTDGKGQQRKIVFVVVGNNLAGDDNFSKHDKYDADKPFAALLAYPRGAALTLFAKNREAAQDLRELKKNSIDENGQPTFEVINFIWDGAAVKAPLGWVLTERRRRAIAWMMGCRTFARDDVTQGIEPLDDFQPPKDWSLPADWGNEPMGDFQFRDEKAIDKARSLRSFNRNELQRLADLLGRQLVDGPPPLPQAMPTSEPP
jgi:hypothetical protein